MRWIGWLFRLAAVTIPRSKQNLHKGCCVSWGFAQPLPARRLVKI
jgi:hypothetical protein